MRRGSGSSGSETTTAAQHVRGSSLLLLGRGISLMLNFAVQVLTVRYLSKSDYGALAFGLAMASIGSSLNLFGLNRAVNRFVPIYQERGQHASMFGGIAFAALALLGLGLALVAVVFGARDLVAAEVASDPRTVELLLILIVLAPVQALDNLCQGLATIFVGARAVFFRRHLLGPGLKLVAVLAVVGLEASVRTLAWSLVAAGSLGLLAYGLLLRRAFRERGWSERFRWRALDLPVRTFLGFGLPLITADLLLVLKVTLGVVLLEAFRGSEEVAAFRAVVPVAGLSLVVLQSFKLLYVPLASRLWARGETGAIRDLFWQTALWIGVVTFPVFGLCALNADALVELLFEDRYASSAGVLVILTLGNFVNAAMGLNAYTLQVFARVRTMAAVNLVSGLVAITLHCVLIPRFGPVGAAWSVTLAVVLQNILNQLALVRGTPVRGIPAPIRRGYAGMLVALGILASSAWLTGGAPLWNLVLLALVSLALLVGNRRELDLTHTFPELRRVPVLGRLLSLEAG